MISIISDTINGHNPGQNGIRFLHRQFVNPKTTLMKNLMLICLLVSIVFSSQAQTTKLLDSYVDWSTNTVLIFLSDTGVSSLSVGLGTVFDSTDVFNQTWHIGTDVSIADNMIEVPLTNVTAGIYFLDLQLNLNDQTVEEMEYQTPSQ